MHKPDMFRFIQCCCLHSPFAYVDPLHCNMAYLYLELLKDSLNEYAYAAELAGLNYDLQNTIYGMYVSIQIILIDRISNFIHDHHSTIIFPRCTLQSAPSLFSQSTVQKARWWFSSFMKMAGVSIYA